MTSQTVVEKSSRELLVDVAHVLMTAHGYDGTSIASICRESGLTVGSLYHFFGSKAGLLAAVLERSQQHFFESLPSPDPSSADGESALRAFWSGATDGIVANVGFFSLDAELVRLSHRDQELRRVFEEQTESAHTRVADGLRPCLVKFDVDPDPVVARLAPVIVTFTRGVVMNSGADEVRIRSQMEAFYPLVYDHVTASSTTK